MIEKKLPTPDQAKKVTQEVVDVIRHEVDEALGDHIDEAMSKSFEKAFTAAKGAAPQVVEKLVTENQKVKEDRRKSAGLLWCAARAGIGKGTMEENAELLVKKLGMSEDIQKAVGGNTGAAGGYLIPQDQGEFIESLFADSIVRQPLGARVVPMPNGNISFPAGSTPPTANWRAEGAVAGSSAPTLRQVTMSAKNLAIVVPINNEYLEDAGSMAMEWIESEARKQAAVTEDLAFIRGTGSSSAPEGMRYQALAANVFTNTKSGASATAAEIYADLGRLVLKLANLDIPMTNAGFAFSKRTEWHLRTLMNANEIPIFGTEMAQGTLWGFSFASTTQIPNNLSVTGSADESEVYFADFDQVMIGQQGGVKMEAVRNAAYYDTGTSAVVSGLSQRQTAVVLDLRVDLGLRYEGKEVAIISDCDWGA